MVIIGINCKEYRYSELLHWIANRSFCDSAVCNVGYSMKEIVLAPIDISVVKSAKKKKTKTLAKKICLKYPMYQNHVIIRDSKDKASVEIYDNHTVIFIASSFLKERDYKDSIKRIICKHFCRRRKFD